MRQPAVTLSLVVVLILSLLGLQQMVTQHSPEQTLNVLLVLLLGFLAVGSFFALLSQLLLSQLFGPQSNWTTLRHGGWAGLIAVLLPLLRWMDILRPLVVVAVLIIVVGLESLILLRSDSYALRRRSS